MKRRTTVLIGLILMVGSVTLLPTAFASSFAHSATSRVKPTGNLSRVGVTECGRYSKPIGQAAATTKPVIAEAVPWGLSLPSAIKQAASHGITGFSIDSAAPNIFPQVLQCSNALRKQGIDFSSAVLLNLNPGSIDKQSLRHQMSYIIRQYMSDEAYLHVDLGGKSRPVLFIYYGAQQSDDPSIIQAINWLRDTAGTKNVVFLVDPGPDCRVGNGQLTAAQMLEHVDGVYIDDNCDANSQNVMSSDIHSWNQRHPGQQRAWFASARADSGVYSQNWGVATATDPIAVTICSWNNPSYPDIAGNKSLLSITSAKSKAWRG